MSTPPMNQELQKLLAQASISEKIIKQLESDGCCTSEFLSDWFDEPKEVTAMVKAVLGEADPHKKAQSAGLKGMCWQLSAKVTQTTKRLAEGISSEDLDEPLDVEVHKDMVATAATYWRWPRFDARAIGSDSAIGRMRRAFLVHQP